MPIVRIPAEGMFRLVARIGVTATLETDPYPLGQANDLTLVVTVPSIFVDGGGTSQLSWQPRGSDDGQNWVDLIPVVGSATTAGVYGSSDDTAPALVKVSFAFDIVMGDPENWGAVDFHAQVNLTQAAG